MWQQYVAAVAIAWCTVLFSVICIGSIQIYRYFSTPIRQPTSSNLPLAAIPHVTIIRPIVGLEPYLEDCLTSTFTQDYPPSKLTISFCIASPHDVSLPILKRLVAKYPEFDTRIYIETEDPNLRLQDGGRAGNLGPNPKIRNMSRAYREARGDIIWIADCNVWLHERTCGLMVDLLCGFQSGRKDLRGAGAATCKYKFVHQLPLAVDVSHLPPSPESASEGARHLGDSAGGLLEELFMSTAHVKFYTAISTVAVAPCTVGKSNMFRRSHLDALTQPKEHGEGRSPGIDFFSDNICEDHLIGDLLWKTPVPQSVQTKASSEGLETDNAPSNKSTRSWHHHALLLNPPCIQPQYKIRLSTYAARRTRWLRVRKFTVPVATLVEPATESLVASSIAAWVLTTKYIWPQTHLPIPETWSAFTCIWFSIMIAWIATDRTIWKILQSWSGNAQNERAMPPVFIGAAVAQHRPWNQWFKSWLGRELLACPVWIWAVLGGTRVVWRGRKFWVGVDMKVHEIVEEQNGNKKTA